MTTITLHCPVCGIDTNYVVSTLDITESVEGEVLAGTKDGINDTFTTSYAFIPGSEQVILNRQVMKRTEDYVPTGASSQIVFGVAPPTAADITISYQKA